MQFDDHVNDNKQTLDDAVGSLLAAQTDLINKLKTHIELSSKSPIDISQSSTSLDKVAIARIESIPYYIDKIRNLKTNLDSLQSNVESLLLNVK